MSALNVLQLCQKGIDGWQAAFNNQDAAGCAAQYCANAVMHARPFGIFNGRKEIREFWQGIMDQGFAEVDYTDVTWEETEDGGYILTASWTMNKAFGVVHREHWIIDEDGLARLISDDFEVQGER